MTNPQKDKGDRAELAGASLLSDLTGFKVVRKLGAGRAEDTGDLWGIPDTVIQVAHWADPLAAIRAKVRGAEAQRINAGATFAATALDGVEVVAWTHEGVRHERQRCQPLRETV